jgi:arsenate reductase (thioredoxin)
MPMKKRVLFLCTANRARSQMAEALVNHDLGEVFEAFSAGTRPTAPHPLALAVLAEIGIDHSAARSKSLDEFADQEFDHVITLCDDANEECPVFFGKTRRAHLGFEDPDGATGTPDAIRDVFRRVRDAIREKVEIHLVRAERPERAVKPVRKE